MPAKFKNLSDILEIFSLRMAAFQTTSQYLTDFSLSDFIQDQDTWLENIIHCCEERTGADYGKENDLLKMAVDDAEILLEDVTNSEVLFTPIHQTNKENLAPMIQTENNKQTVSVSHK